MAPPARHTKSPGCAETTKPVFAMAFPCIAFLAGRTYVGSPLNAKEELAPFQRLPAPAAQRADFKSLASARPYWAAEMLDRDPRVAGATRLAARPRDRRNDRRAGGAAGRPRDSRDGHH